jgi:hypothetical protein
MRAAHCVLLRLMVGPQTPQARSRSDNQSTLRVIAEA